MLILTKGRVWRVEKTKAVFVERRYLWMESQ